MKTEKKVTWGGLLNLFVVYFVWGSTYLAIRVAVREGSGFPPFALGAMRVLPAAAILIALGALARKRVRLTRRELVTLIFSGLLLWLGGNGMVNWSEQRADSSIAALMIAATPIWVAITEAILDRRLPSLRFAGALMIGFSGIAVLSWPVLRSGVRADILAIIGLLIAGFSWGLGTILQSRRPVGVQSVVSAGYQQLFGGIGFVLIFLLSSEPVPNPIPEAWWAWGYLVVFGSLFSFTAYVRAVELLPTSIVMTYPYVNPVIAVFLGWIILNEPITMWTIAGAVLVLLGVAGIFQERRINGPRP
ncbi:MAG: EamA family transporter [Anaerolineales bacterium]|nr:EamA family transporter [Anaerolineales bacterium]